MKLMIRPGPNDLAVHIHKNGANTQCLGRIERITVKTFLRIVDRRARRKNRVHINLLFRITNDIWRFIASETWP